MKVCILSKDRAGIMTTHLFFHPQDVLIFVDPHEVKKYQIFYPEYNIVSTEKSNQGVSYARNYILNNVKDPKLIMSDDDITFLGIKSNTGRYEELKDATIILKDIEKNLDKYWSLTIPLNAFAYFSNKQVNLSRYFFNTTSLAVFYGLNRTKINEHNIRFDESMSDGEFADFTAKVIICGGTICVDQMYSRAAKGLSLGGLSAKRSLNLYNLDALSREATERLSRKYGAEFIKISHDSNGYITGYYFNYKLLCKRKEIAKKNMTKYLENRQKKYEYED